MKHISVRVVLLIALGVSGTQLLAPETFGFRAGDLVIQLTPDVPGGHLTMSLGPFGELTWRTHAGPLDVHARFVIRPAADELPSPEEFRDLRVAFVLRKLHWLLLTGIIAGAFVALDRPRERQLIDMGIGAGVLVGIALIMVGISAFTFNADALRDPGYRGPIKDAPRILQLLKEVQRDWSSVQRNINAAVAGLERLHGEIVTDSSPPPDDTVRLLLISDVHNNPLGLLIAKELATRFGADGVLNAGDITDRGSQPEAALFERFGDFNLPHVIAAGNHEDTSMMQRLRALPRVTVLESGRSDHVTIQGITILGDSDPNAYTIDSDPFNERAEQQLPLRCEALAARIDAVSPEVVLVHDERLGACAAREAELRGLTLVFANGHSHRQRYREHGTVIEVNPGTSGANGFKSATDLPYGFALLEFDPETVRPVSVCLFQFDKPGALRANYCHIARKPAVP